MPDVSIIVTAIIAVISALVSIGITYGVITTRQKTLVKDQGVSDKRIDATIGELKDAVKELKSLASDIQVMKSTGARNERDIEDHEKRIASLEIHIAKLQARLE